MRVTVRRGRGETRMNEEAQCVPLDESSQIMHVASTRHFEQTGVKARRLAQTINDWGENWLAGTRATAVVEER